VRDFITVVCLIVYAIYCPKPPGKSINNNMKLRTPRNIPTTALQFPTRPDFLISIRDKIPLIIATIAGITLSAKLQKESPISIPQLLPQSKGGPISRNPAITIRKTEMNPASFPGARH
jgi:hypothetical protein